MKRLSLFALFLLGGCYATAEPIFLPDGSAGYRLTCGNYVGNQSDCLQKAGDTCGANGYQMYDASGHMKTDDDQNKAVISALNTTPVKTDKNADKQEHIFIKCRPSPVIQTPVPDNKPMPLPDTKPPVPDAKTAPPTTNGQPLPLSAQ